MIIERNEFHLKFGKAKEALEIWTQICEKFKKGSKDHTRMRVMTDMTGDAYVLVVELELRDLVHIGFKNYEWMTNDEAHALYARFVPLCNSSNRTLYKLECDY